MTFREQVARWLYCITYPMLSNTSLGAWEARSQLYRDAWMRTADEVIRLMEWARREGWTDGFDDVLDPENATRGWPPLTLPPGGWTP